MEIKGGVGGIDEITRDVVSGQGVEGELSFFLEDEYTVVVVVVVVVLVLLLLLGGSASFLTLRRSIVTTALLQILLQALLPNLLLQPNQFPINVLAPHQHLPIDDPLVPMLNRQK